MLRIDPEEGEEDGETKQVKLKIDQNLFTYPNARAPQGRGRIGSTDTPSTSMNSSYNASSGSDSSPHLNSTSNSSSSGAPYYAVVSQPPQTPGTPVAKVSTPTWTLSSVLNPGIRNCIPGRDIPDFR